MEGFLTFKGLWPWPWIRSYCHTAYHRASLTNLCIHPTFHW